MKSGLHVSWLHFGGFINTLVKQARQAGVTKVVGVARGGVIAAYAIAQRLNVPVEIIHYSSKVGNGNGKNHKNLLPAHLYSENQKQLVVDDLTDSGHTLKELKDKLPEGVLFATLLHKETSIFKPDFYGMEIKSDICDLWVYFPWDQK